MIKDFKIKLLDRYILKQVIEMFIMGVLVFTSIIFASDTFMTLIKQIAKNTHPYISIGVGETIRTAAFGLTMDFHHYAVQASCPALPWHLLYVALGLPVLYVRLRDSPFYRRLLPFC